MEKNIDMIVEDLVNYYEAAGFDHFYEKVLKDKSEQKIRELYRQVFEQ